MGKGVPCDGKRRQKIDTHIACSFIKRKMWAFDRHRTCNCVSGQCQLKRAGAGTQARCRQGILPCPKGRRTLSRSRGVHLLNAPNGRAQHGLRADCRAHPFMRDLRYQEAACRRRRFSHQASKWWAAAPRRPYIAAPPTLCLRHKRLLGWRHVRPRDETA